MYNRCINGIKESLKVTLDCVNRTSNILEFGVNILIILKCGETKDILVSKGTLSSIVITDNVLIYDKITILLCEISKIKILTSTVTNQAFVNCLVKGLKCIAMKDYGCNHGCDYYAITEDDGYDTMTGRKINHSNYYCKRCKAKTNKNKIYANKGNIESVGFTGNTEQINVIEKIHRENVVKDIISSKKGVVSDISISINDINLLDILKVKPVSVVNDIRLTQTSLITNVNQIHDSVIKDIHYEPIDVITKVVTDNTTVLSGVEVSTASINEVSIVEQNHVVGKVFTDNIEVITKINPVTDYITTGYPLAQSVTVLDGSRVAQAKPLTISYTLISIPKETSGFFEVIIPAGIIDGKLPLESITLPVQYNGIPVEVFQQGDISLISGDNAVPAFEGEISTVKVISDLGEPSWGEVVTDVLSETALISKITNIESVTINDIMITDSITVLTDIRIKESNISNVSSIKTNSLDKMTRKEYAEVVKGIVTTDKIINSIEKKDEIIINEIEATSITVVTQVSENINKIDVVEDIGCEFKGVVSSVDIKETNVLSTINSEVEGKVLYVGCGIMVILEYSGNISIYSLFEINSFTTK